MTQTTIEQEIYTVRQDLRRIEDEKNKPAQLAQRLVELEQAQAAQQARKQAMLDAYSEVIAPSQQRTVEAMRQRLANIAQAGSLLRSMVDDLLGEVKAYSGDALSLAKEVSTDKAAAAALTGSRINPADTVDLVTMLAFDQRHTDLLELLALVTSAKALRYYSNQHIRPVASLTTGRNVQSFATEILQRLPDVGQRISQWESELHESQIETETTPD